MNTKHTGRILALSILTLTLGSALPAAEDLPKAPVIFDRYLDVTGGKAAYDKIHSSIASGSLEIAAQGLKGTLKVYSMEPDKSYTLVEIAGVGKMEEGTNSGVAWALSALQGARVKSGDERATALRSADLAAVSHWKKYYSAAETVGVEDVNGKPAYKVVLTPIEGKPETDYYDKASGMLVKEVATFSSPMGEIPMEVNMADYHKEGDLTVAHKITQNAAGQEFVVTIENVVFNPEIPKDRFDLPAEIKTLVDKNGSGATEPAKPADAKPADPKPTDSKPVAKPQ